MTLVTSWSLHITINWFQQWHDPNDCGTPWAQPPVDTRNAAQASASSPCPPDTATFQHIICCINMYISVYNNLYKFIMLYSRIIHSSCHIRIWCIILYNSVWILYKLNILIENIPHDGNTQIHTVYPRCLTW